MDHKKSIQKWNTKKVLHKMEYKKDSIKWNIMLNTNLKKKDINISTKYQ
jgi:hypothetical protein